MLKNIKKLLPFFLIICLTLLSLIISGAKLPISKGSPELLFPRNSESVSNFKKDKIFFEDVIFDTLVLEQYDNENYFDLDNLIDDLENLSEIKKILKPNFTQDDLKLGLSNENQDYRLILKIFGNLNFQQQVELDKKIESILNKYPTLKILRVGSFSISIGVSNFVSSEVQKIIPVIILALSFSVFFLAPNFISVFTILFSTFSSLSFTLFCYTIFGKSLGPISQLAPPFLLAINTAYNIHLRNRLTYADEENFFNTKKEVIKGSGLATITTVLSLLSLNFLDVKDVGNFSLLASFGTIVAFLFSIIIQTNFVKREIKIYRKERILKVVKILYKSKKINIAILLVTGILAVQTFKLKIHTDPLTFLPQSHKLNRDYQKSTKLFNGHKYLTLIVNNNSKKINFNKLERINKVIEKHNLVTNVISGVSFAKQKQFENLSLTKIYSPIRAFVNKEKNSYKFLIETSLEGNPLIKFKEKIKNYLQQNEITKGLNLSFTSFELIMAEQTNQIVYGLIKSIFFCFFIVFLISLFLFKSFKIAFLSIIPNLFPVINVFGIMAITLNYLDFASCLVASTALGIAVDNTYHFLLALKSSKSSHYSKDRIIEHTIEKTYSAFINTTLILCISFSCMLITNSSPVMYFGIFICLALLIGLIADLVVLPFILSLKGVLN